MCGIVSGIDCVRVRMLGLLVRKILGCLLALGRGGISGGCLGCSGSCVRCRRVSLGLG